MTNKQKSGWLLPCFFLLSGAYFELVLALSNFSDRMTLLILLRITLAGCAYGGIIWLVFSLIPWRKLRIALAGLLLFLGAGFTIAEHCCNAFFGTFFGVGFMLRMSGQVAGGFMGETLRTIGKNFWFFLLELVPFAAFFVVEKWYVPTKKQRICSLAFAVLLSAAAVGTCYLGGDRSIYTTEFETNRAVPRFGLVNAIRLEVKYAIFGMPEPEIQFEPPVLTVPPTTAAPTTLPPKETDPTEEPAEETEVPEETEPVVYGYHVSDIDFAAMIEQDSTKLMATMDAYFGSQMPTMENEYTGRFAGKNLIYITAEAFSPSVIDKIRTPTLYRMTHTGFCFTNFYQPSWNQSTTGGEFAAMTGIIPTWPNGNTAFGASIGKDMPYGMGWKFTEQGYVSRAYHNNAYTYYDRHKTHPNLGYDYHGIGNGLVLENRYSWPESDLEMMKSTIPDMIQEYLDTGVPFNTYYMSVSGHANYGFDFNSMSKLNRDVVEGMQYSSPVRAYLACQTELEYALEYIVNQLEAAGILDDTVFVMTADHYPYALTQKMSKDYYAELTGRNDDETNTSRYRNTLILWCSEMEDETIRIDKPCSSVDMVPTVYNLFGIPYDSRLLSGRDILDTSVAPGEVSTAMNIVIFPDYGKGQKSWITEVGIYEAGFGFEPFPDVDVPEGYVAAVDSIVQDRWNFAKYILEQDYYAHVFPDWEPER